MQIFLLNTYKYIAKKLYFIKRLNNLVVIYKKKNKQNLIKTNTNVCMFEKSLHVLCK